MVPVVKRTATLVHAWLVLDFFAESRKSGGGGSSLTTTIFAQAFLGLVFASLLYPETPPVPFAAANLTLSCLLIGIGTLGDVQQQNRKLADAVLLGPSPLRAFDIVLARVVHGAFYVCLLTVGMALPPAILFGWLVRDATKVPLYLLLACLCSGLAVGALAVLLRFSRRVLGIGRTALLSGTLKAALLALGVVGFALGMRGLGKGPEAMPIGRLGIELMPTWHAARFLVAPLQQLSHGVITVGAGVVLLLLGVLVGERESARADRAGRDRVLLPLARRIARRGPLLGLTAFVATMLYRSAGFRARVLPLLGVPAAMAFLALQDGGASVRGRQLFVAMGLQFPAIYLPFLIAFLPRADQPDTGWVFEQSPRASVALAQRAAYVALCTHVLLPVHTLALATMLLAGIGAVFALPVAGFSLGAAMLVARGQIRALEQLPFTQAGDADAGKDLGSPFASAILLSLLAAGFALASAGVQAILAVTFLGAGIAVLATAGRPEAP